MTTNKRKPTHAVLDFGDRTAVRRQALTQRSAAAKRTRGKRWSREALRALDWLLDRFERRLNDREKRLDLIDAQLRELEQRVTGLEETARRVVTMSGNPDTLAAQPDRTAEAAHA